MEKGIDMKLICDEYAELQVTHAEHCETSAKKIAELEAEVKGLKKELARVNKLLAKQQADVVFPLLAEVTKRENECL